MSSQDRSDCGRSGVQRRNQRQDARPPPAPLPLSRPKAGASDQSGSSEARKGARGTKAEPGRRCDHRFRRIDALCLRPRHLVRLPDRLRRGGLAVRPLDDGRLARGHLPLDLSADLAEPRRCQAPGHRRPAVEDCSGGGQANLELLDLSRQILTLTREVRALAGPDGGQPSLPRKSQ